MLYFYMHHDMAEAIPDMYQFQHYLDGKATNPLGPKRDPYTIIGSFNQYTYTYLELLLSKQATKRMSILSSRMLSHYAKHKTLPKDKAELEKILGTEYTLFTANDDQIGLTYELLAPGRFRFGYDLSSPPPYGLKPFDPSWSIAGKPITHATKHLRGKKKKAATTITSPAYNFVDTGRYIEINAAHSGKVASPLLRTIIIPAAARKSP